MRTVILGAVVFLLIAVAFAWYVWQALGDVAISGHGLIALALGVSISFLLGVGLMSLVFYSNRHGYDDEAGRD